MDHKRPSPMARLILCIPVALICGLIGLSIGGEVARVVARSQGRDIGELKDMYVWSSLAAAPVLALGSIWACLAFTRTAPTVVRLAGAAFGVAVLGAAALVVGAYEPIKTAGSPVLAYELRLPASLKARDHSEIDVTIWSERDGFGCSITSLRVVGGRQVVSGACVIGKANRTPTMSLRLQPNSEDYWRVPFGPDASLGTSFGEWSALQFIPPPRQSMVPLPAGTYEIRYWIRRFT